MSRFGQLARLNNGVVVSAKCDVFFVDEQSARKCIEKYGGEIEKLDDGWRVTKTVAEPIDNDPLVQAIRKSLIEAGLIKSS